jgi:hypothetical protein
MSGSEEDEKSLQLLMEAKERLDNKIARIEKARCVKALTESEAKKQSDEAICVLSIPPTG